MLYDAGDMIKNLTIAAIIVFIFMCAGYASYVLTGHSWSVPSTPNKEDTINTADNTSSPFTAAQKPSARMELEKMTPHRALYDIRLIESHNTAQIVNISGQMYFEWNKTCDAWTTDHRFSLLYEYADSPAMLVTSDFSTWEGHDGRTFVFSTRRSRNGELYEDIRGQAVLNEDGSGGQATYSMPEELTMDLPAGTLFPMMHTFMLSEKMDRMPSPFLNAVVFDGSDAEGPVEINAFLGKNVTPVIPESDLIEKDLLSGPARKLHMAFFPLVNAFEAASDYEMESVFYQNSVIGDMRISYDEFSIAQDLVAIEPVADPQDMSKCP